MSKVIELLQGLQTKVSKDGQDEAKAFEDYAKFCRKEIPEKQNDIKISKSSIEGDRAKITEAKGEIQAASSRIEVLNANVAKAESSQTEASTLRTKENAEFVAKEKELTETVEMLGKAYAELSKPAKKAASFLQVDAANSQEIIQALATIVDTATLSNTKALTSLLQGPVPGGKKGILNLLTDLTGKAKSQLEELRTEETKASHSFAMLSQSLQLQIKAAKDEIKQKQDLVAAKSEAKATAQGDLANHKQALKADTAAEKQLQAQCADAAQDYEDSKKATAEELKALQLALDAVSKSTKGAAAVAYKSFLQVAFTHRHMQAGVDNDAFAAVDMVHDLAAKGDSLALTQLAHRLDTVMRLSAVEGADPFAKVREMINGLLDKLKKEDSAADNQKAYCDKETKKTVEKLASLNTQGDKVNIKLSEKKARSETLKAEAGTLRGELAEIAKMSAKMNEVRAKERAAFEETKATLEEGLAGIRAGLKVIRDFYAGAAAAPSFLQAPGRPKRRTKAATGGQSVIDLMELVESDFGRNLVQAKTDEEAKEADLKKMVQKNKLDTAVKEDGVKMKIQTAAALDQNVKELISDADAVKAELKAVQEYEASIKKACVKPAETYEERQAKRQAELAGLRQALTVLNGQTALLQQQTRGLRIRAH